VEDLRGQRRMKGKVERITFFINWRRPGGGDRGSGNRVKKEERKGILRITKVQLNRNGVYRKRGEKERGKNACRGGEREKGGHSQLDLPLIVGRGGEEKSWKPAPEKGKEGERKKKKAKNTSFSWPFRHARQEEGDGHS